MTRSAAQIRKSFGVPDQATEDRMVRAFRAALRPRKKAGRKLDEATARADEMWDRYGNLKQSKIYAFGNFATPARTFDFNYLHESNANYAPKFIVNRVTEVYQTEGAGLSYPS